MYNKESYDKIVKEIFDMQHLLNIDFCGEDYTTTLVSSNTGKKIRFGNAMISEAMEMLDNIPWKHWGKDTFVNTGNMKTEAIDIIHFVMAIAKVYQDRTGRNINYIFQSNSLDFGEFNPKIGPDELFDITTEYISHATLLGSMFNLSFSGNSSVDNKYIYVLEILDEIREVIHLSFKILFVLFNYQAIDVLKDYVVKNTLNRFRKEHGYAEGDYVKIWHGKEDNDFVADLIKDYKHITIKDLYSLMSIKYSTVLNEK